MQDQRDACKGSRAMDMWSFLFLFLMEKFGLESLARRHAIAVIASTIRYRAKALRVLYFSYFLALPEVFEEALSCSSTAKVTSQVSALGSWAFNEVCCLSKTLATNNLCHRNV